MKKPSINTCFQIRLEKFLGQNIAVHVQLRDGTQRGDFCSADIIHRQHAARAVIEHGQRNEQVRKFLQIIGQRGQIGRLPVDNRVPAKWNF